MQQGLDGPTPRRGGFISRQSFRIEQVRIIHAEGGRDERVHEEVGHVQDVSGFFDVQAPIEVGDVVEARDPAGGLDPVRRLVAEVRVNTRAPRLVQHTHVIWGPAPPAPGSGTALPDGYRLVPSAPEAADYLWLRREAGLTPRTEEQAVRAVAGGWYAVHVRHGEPAGGPTGDSAGGSTVAMGRLIGDGGACFHVVDLAVLPGHQRRGLGDAILGELLRQVRDRAPAGADVTLMADPPGHALYARHGFVESAPRSVGMRLEGR